MSDEGEAKAVVCVCWVVNMVVCMLVYHYECDKMIHMYYYGVCILSNLLTHVEAVRFFGGSIWDKSGFWYMVVFIGGIVYLAVMYVVGFFLLMDAQRDCGSNNGILTNGAMWVVGVIMLVVGIFFFFALYSDFRGVIERGVNSWRIKRRLRKKIENRGELSLSDIDEISSNTNVLD